MVLFSVVLLSIRHNIRHLNPGVLIQLIRKLYLFAETVAVRQSRPFYIILGAA